MPLFPSVVMSSWETGTVHERHVTVGVYTLGPAAGRTCPGGKLGFLPRASRSTCTTKRR